MSEAENGASTSEIKTPLGSVSFTGKRAAEFITILSLCLLFVLAYGFWEHKMDVKAGNDVTRDVLKELVMGIRESNCLTTFKEEAREAKAEFCKRVSR